MNFRHEVVYFQSVTSPKWTLIQCERVAPNPVVMELQGEFGGDLLDRHVAFDAVEGLAAGAGSSVRRGMATYALLLERSLGLGGGAHVRIVAGDAVELAR